ncbi:unnamed protein product [Acanthoscelides obtectus]|uniref:UBC core domain-containing protein n=1 Tax=Acanthoscelides obtectus TaxID=200917 RepID=A0A9P0L119_ACAOB|nr:unnamed protein product [Acanthoscelides obtectus]CAK1673137.1 Ubiquitin-conjugating enzyme E2 G2 [Acanthoscelides obtectus]
MAAWRCSLKAHLLRLPNMNSHCGFSVARVANDNIFVRDKDSHLRKENLGSLQIKNIHGPEGTCFEGGVFPAKLIFPPDYPLSPPKMQFTCEMFHPNIYADGRVCISILHAPGDDPMGYESSAERWSPVQSNQMTKVVQMLMQLKCGEKIGKNLTK